MIELRSICKRYGDFTALENVNTVINSGEIVAIIGPSGCGKSTLLNCINVLEKPTEGQVIFDGTDLTAPECDIKEQRKRIGMVFQQFNLFGHMTVLENAITPQMDLMKKDRQQACDNAMKYLRLVGMADKIWHYPNELSGGQKQRAAIARTLAMDPEVLLLDEPTSALDPTMVGEVEYVLRKLAERGKTMVFVTHEMRLARQLSTRVIYIDEKGIYEDAPTEKMFTCPEREKTRRFILNHKCLDIMIDSADFDYIDAMESIREFCMKMAFDSKRTTLAQLVFEELCAITLMPQMSKGSTINATFEFDEQNDRLTFKVSHQGKAVLDELKADDSITGRLIGNISDEIEIIEKVTRESEKDILQHK